MTESSINSNHCPLNIWIKMTFIELLLHRKLSFIRVYSQVIEFDGLFGTHPEILPPFRQVWSLGFLWSTSDIFYVFLFDFLKWNLILCHIYWIPDLQLLKLVCLWWRKLGSENMQIPDFFGQHGHAFERRVKTLQILVEFFQFSLNLLTKELLMNTKIR